MNNYKKLRIDPSFFSDELLFDKDIVKALIKARESLATINGMYKQSKIKKALLSSVVLFEAVASSRKEGVNTTLEKMYKSQISDNISDNEIKALSSFYTMMDITASPNEIVRFRLAKSICQRVENGCEFRENKIAKIEGSNSGIVIYTPPSGKDLLYELITYWENFINSDQDNIDPVLVMIIAHYQFEAIHPFTDGNGRTGRILNGYTLVNKGIIEDFIMPLSYYCTKYSTEYDGLLRAVTETDAWKDWILFMLKGITESCQISTNIFDNMTTLYDFYMLEAKDLPYKQEFISLIFEQPVVTTRVITERLNVSYKIARRIADAVVELGLLERHKTAGKVRFLNSAIISLMIEIYGG